MKASNVDLVFLVKVAVDGIWKVCPEAGGPVQFTGFNGNYAVYSQCIIYNISSLVLLEP